MTTKQELVYEQIYKLFRKFVTLEFTENYTEKNVKKQTHTYLTRNVDKEFVLSNEKIDNKLKLGFRQLCILLKNANRELDAYEVAKLTKIQIDKFFRNFCDIYVSQNRCLNRIYLSLVSSTLHWLNALS